MIRHDLDSICCHTATRLDMTATAGWRECGLRSAHAGVVHSGSKYVGEHGCRNGSIVVEACSCSAFCPTAS